MSCGVALHHPIKKPKMAAKRKLVKLAKGVSTFSMMLFNDKRPTSVPQECPVVRESADILAKVLLPAVNDILSRMEYTEQAIKAQQKFDSYTNVRARSDVNERVVVAPSVGMIIATDTMSGSGPSWVNWKFLQVTNITSNGVVMVKEMKKVSHHNQTDGFLSNWIVTPAEMFPSPKPTMLASSNLFDVWTAETEFIDKKI
jgi:hypothetical protein